MSRSSRAPLSLALAALALAALGPAALPGCGGSAEELAPLPVDAGVTDAGDDGGGGAPPADAGPPKRTVMKRNPFGNVAETENLLWDGDFEWYTAFADQYGWLSGPSLMGLSFALPDVKLGAACRSGLRCASLAKGHVIAGLGVASQGNKLAVSLWAHLSTGACDDVQVTLLDYNGLFDTAFQVDPDVVIKPLADQPDADGWCHLAATVDPRQGKPVLLVKNATKGEALIDDVVIKKAPAAQALAVVHGPPGAELAADLAVAREALRKLRGPHDAPPNEARRAFEKSRARP